MRRHIRRSRRKFFSIKAWRIRVVFWTGAILVGCVTLLFAKLSHIADDSFIAISQQYPWAPFLLTPVGLMLVGWLTRRFYKGSEGSGVPQVISSLENNKTPLYLSIRVAFGKLTLTILSLFSGASVGIQGPSVHIGACIMYSLRKFAVFPAYYYQKGLIIAGGAAGFAAAFNTPLAGIVFAFEELSRSFEQKTNGIILTAVILSGMTAMALQGNQSYFSVSETVFEFDVSLIITILLCSLIGGLLGGLFSQLLISGSRLLKPWLTNYPLTVICLLGLIIATTGYLSGHNSFGTGYLEANAIVSGVTEYDPLFPLYKFIATMASYFTGIPGGIFAPSLATGAGIGQSLSHFLPLAPASFMILIGMVAYFSGVIQAPITAMVIVLEMTANSSMIFPLMISAFIGSGMSSLVCPRSLFRVMAENFSHEDRETKKEKEKD